MNKKNALLTYFAIHYPLYGGEDPLKENSRSMIRGILEECIRIKSPRLKTFLSYLKVDVSADTEEVMPQRRDLLHISYKPRSLEEYDEPTK